MGRRAWLASSLLLVTGINLVLALFIGAGLIGVGIAAYLVEVAPERVNRVVGFLVELLAAVPSIATMRGAASAGSRLDSHASRRSLSVPWSRLERRSGVVCASSASHPPAWSCSGDRAQRQ